MIRSVAPHLRQPTTRIGNLWLLEHGTDRILIDTGHPLERPSLLAELLLKGGIRGAGDLTAILLTHRHNDHAGNAAWMRKRFGARVYCHENDAAALQGRGAGRSQDVGGNTRPKVRFYERWIASYEDRAPALCEIDDVYTEGAWRWGFQVIPVPGHTEGSVMLFHQPTRTLFTGDAILVGPPLVTLPRLTDLPGFRKLKTATDPKYLRLADAAFSQDVASCHLAVRRFLRNAPQVDFLCPGHGVALDEGIDTRFARLLRDSG